MSDDYSDIIRHPRYRLRSHRPMSEQSRAAQFSAFAALTGYDEEIGEAARLTDMHRDLSEDALAALDEAFAALTAPDAGRKQITVTYFQPDFRKGGGAYITRAGEFRFYDAEAGMLRFTDGSSVPAAYLCEITFQAE